MLTGYQYETSPRKLRPEYSASKQKRKPKKSSSSGKTSEKTSKKKSSKIQNNPKLKFKIALNAIFVFAILFGMIYQNSQITQTFSEIQSLKAAAAEIEKENDQLEIGIQNELNMNNIEDIAKNKLGMQKLTTGQTKYVNLPKKDYIETSPEEIIIEQNKGFISKIIEKIKSIF